MPINSSNPRLPDFIQQRVDAFWSERFYGEFGGKHILHGRPFEKGDLLLNHNDYLNLGGHPKVRDAQIQSLQAHAEGSLMSAVFQCDDAPQKRLEQELSDFLLAEECIITQSGYAANVGLLQTIASPGLPVYIDMLAHMSLWEGIRSSGAKARPFRHNNMRHLEAKLSCYGAGIVVIDSLYSTDGSLAPLIDAVELCERHNSILIVDESHSLGTHGPQGAGLVVAAGLQNRVAFRTASLAKAFAGRGGVVVAGMKFHTYFLYSSFPAIFSSALLPYEIAGLRETLALIKKADEARNNLRNQSKILAKKLRDIGYKLGTDSQIISPEPGYELATMKFRDDMEKEGVIGAVFCPPATPNRRACVRFSLHSNITSKHVEHIVGVCSLLYRRHRASDWLSCRRNRVGRIYPSDVRGGRRELNKDARSFLMPGKDFNSAAKSFDDLPTVGES